MKNKYFEKLSKNKKIGQDTIKGCTEKYINEVQKRLKVKFPKSYIEYLLLAGDYSGNLPILENPNLAFVSDPEILEQIQDQMDLDNVVIDRPFWVFTTADGVECFWFFYLDEDDDDPKVYAYDEFGLTVCTRPIGDDKHLTFSELVNRQLEYALLTQKRGY